MFNSITFEGLVEGFVAASLDTTTIDGLGLDGSLERADEFDLLSLNEKTSIISPSKLCVEINCCSLECAVSSSFAPLLDAAFRYSGNFNSIVCRGCVWRQGAKFIKSPYQMGNFQCLHLAGW